VALWIVLGAAGLAILAVTFRLAGLDRQSNKRPTWLLVGSLVLFAIGLGLVVAGARS
jgi:uncharacterized membrane protein YidH (DUF202 family)